MMKIVVISITLLLFAASALATTYTWEDDQGTVNFAEDYGKIPKKYRKKAKVLGEEEQDLTPAPEAEKKTTKPAPEGETGDKRKAPEDDSAKARGEYGGKEGSAWKSEFDRLNVDLKAAEDQLVELRGRLKETSGMSRSEYLSLQLSIRNIETRVLALRKKRDALAETADKAGVPGELR